MVVKFTRDAEKILNEIEDCVSGLYYNIIELHETTNWTYDEILDKVGKNVDYYSLKDIMKFMIDSSGVKNDSWNEDSRDNVLSF